MLSLEHLLDLFKIGSSDFFFPLGPLLSGRQDHGLRGQGEDLIERRLISQQRPQDQSFSGLPQGGKVNLQKAGDAVILIKAQSVSIRNRDQKKIEKDFQGGEISQKPSREEAMINPAEGALDLADSFGLEKSFGWHSRHPRFSMIPFSFRPMGLSN